MSVLDRSRIARDDPTTIALHELMIRAYDDEVEALALAGQVGILRADIERHPKLRFTWWSILEVAAAEGQLRRLIDTALRDPTIAGWHVKIRQIVEVPSGSLLTAAAVARAAGRETSDARGAASSTEVGEQASLWKPGTVLQGRFLDGTAQLHERVEKAAMEWFEYADLKLEFGNARDAPLRISFKQPGSWSYMSLQALKVPESEPTINFGWLDANTETEEVRRVVLHEFGHVLGLLHEQQNPASAIQWNRSKVYDSFTGPPNYWTREQIDQHFFAIWAPGYFPLHKVFDRESIMIFPIQAELLRSGPEIGWNRALSGVDKQFVAALYPKPSR